MRRAVFAIAAAGLLQFLGTGRIEAWLLAWFAAAPVLRFAYRSSSGWAAFAVAAGASLLGSADLVAMYAGQLPVAVLVTFGTVGAVLFGAAVLAARGLVRRLPPDAAVFAYPLIAVVFDLAGTRLSPDGTAASIAYSQVACLPLLQVTSIAGLAGVTFLVSLPSSALALARRGDVRSVRACWTAAALLAGGLVFGGARLALAKPQPQVAVGLVANDRAGISINTEDPAMALAAVHAFLPRIHDVAARGARYVVMPEEVTALRPAWDRQVKDLLAAAARAERVWLVAGFRDWTGQAEPLNVAVVFDPEGRIVADYAKRHLVPGFEARIRPGNRPLALGDGTGVAICKDLDFVDVGRESALAGDRLLLVPAWDFSTDARYHARMAIGRAVESGFALARSASHGLLTASDAYGRIVGQAPSATGELFAGALPLGPGPTFYTRHGDLFGLAAIGALAGLILRAWVARRPRAAGAAEADDGARTSRQEG
jgi:apolipoprotein N-acyltransferase